MCIHVYVHTCTCIYMAPSYVIVPDCVVLSVKVFLMGLFTLQLHGGIDGSLHSASQVYTYNIVYFVFFVCSGAGGV